MTNEGKYIKRLDKNECMHKKLKVTPIENKIRKKSI